MELLQEDQDQNCEQGLFLCVACVFLCVDMGGVARVKWRITAVDPLTSVAGGWLLGNVGD